MHVLMTADCVGGVWSYATTLCRALASEGVTATLAVIGGDLPDHKRREAEAISNVTLRHRSLKCEWMHDSLEDVEEAGRWLEELAEDADVIHLNDFAHGSQVLASRPRLIVAHSCVFSWFFAVRGVAPDVRWSPYHEMVCSGLAGADAVVAPTAAMLGELSAHYGFDRGGQVIANATHSVVQSTPLRRPFVLSAGRVWDEGKNIRTLAAAAKGLAWPVKVAGDAAHPDGGSASFDNVRLLGPLPHDALLREMGRAGIYALPAKYEPFGLSALEAALAGCPLVLGDTASLREVWADAALFVPPDDTDALRQAIESLITDPAHRKDMARRARQRAMRYRPETMARAYVETYRQLIRQTAEPEYAS